MLNVHNDLVDATNELIKQTHVHHEKQIQRLEKEIRKKDEMNLIIQQVLIKLHRACWNIVDVSSNKFDEMLSILATLFDHLKAQAPTIEAYDMNQSFQKVFDKFLDLKASTLLTPVVGSFVARGGEGHIWRTQP